MWKSKVPSPDGSVADDSKTYVQALSDAVPEATLKMAEEICLALEVEPTKIRGFRGAGLKQIVNSTIMRHLGFQSWEGAAAAGDYTVRETLARKMARMTWSGPLSQAIEAEAALPKAAAVAAAAAAHNTSPAPGSGAVDDIATLAAFFKASCGIDSDSSQLYAEALVRHHKVGTVKRLKQLSRNGKLADVAKKAGMSEDDLDALQEELASAA